MYLKLIWLHSAIIGQSTCSSPRLLRRLPAGCAAYATIVPVRSAYAPWLLMLVTRGSKTSQGVKGQQPMLCRFVSRSTIMVVLLFQSDDNEWCVSVCYLDHVGAVCLSQQRRASSMIAHSNVQTAECGKFGWACEYGSTTTWHRARRGLFLLNSVLLLFSFH